MSDYDNQSYGRIGEQAGARTDIDEGLRKFMLGVYNYMALGIALTAVVSYGFFMMATTQDPSLAVAKLSNGTLLTSFGHAIYASPLKWVLMFAPLGAVLLFSAMAHKMSAATAQLVFWAFAALMGASLSSIFVRYSLGSISNIFLVTSIMFASLSVFGYATKKDLSGWGQFLFMGVIGLVIASVINIFVGSSALQFAISVIGILVFAGLTAYDTQRIKEQYDYVAHDAEMMKSATINGALSLYLDFINLFIMMLQLFGGGDD